MESERHLGALTSWDEMKVGSQSLAGDAVIRTERKRTNGTYSYSNGTSSSTTKLSSYSSPSS
jgi:hypothetical protein